MCDDSQRSAGADGEAQESDDYRAKVDRVVESPTMTGAQDARVAYLGWHGRGNIGDDAIYDAVRSQLPGAAFLDLPVLTRELIAACSTGLGPLRHSALVVGGGTLVGRAHWRRLVRRGLTLTRRRGSFAIGVGVEDPAFVGRKSGSGRAELNRWMPLLSEFDIVSVRGPRSAELLADAGLEVAVAGDPALLLPQPDVAVEDGLIGVNLGFGDDLWGHDPLAVAREMSAAMRQLAGQGYRFVGILMNGSDRQWTATALADLPAEIVEPADPVAAVRTLARCSAVVVGRLHAGILAAVSATPTVALEYQPKCRDFAMSIDNEHALLRTDTLTSAAVVEQVNGAVAHASAIRATTGAAVAGLRRRLTSDYASLAEQLGLAAG